MTRAQSERGEQVTLSPSSTSGEGGIHAAPCRKPLSSMAMWQQELMLKGFVASHLHSAMVTDSQE
jgi:hypothetical protein